MALHEREPLQRCLQDLVNGCHSKVARMAIETLLTIHRNIRDKMNDNHYRMIKPENPVFNKKVWSLLPCQQFMFECGWILVHNKLIFNCDARLKDIIDVLLENRVMYPDESEWMHSNKLVVESEAKLKDQELRRKAALEREKEIAEYQKDKKRREELAEQLKDQELRRKAALEREKEIAEYQKDKKRREELAKQLKDQELRRKAALEREKEIAEYQKDKKRREELAKQIKAEIQSDIIRRRELKDGISDKQ